MDRPSEVQLALREVFAEWGVLRSPKKAIEGAWVSSTLGGDVDGKNHQRGPGRAESPTKLVNRMRRLLGGQELLRQLRPATRALLASVSELETLTRTMPQIRKTSMQ